MQRSLLVSVLLLLAIGSAAVTAPAGDFQIGGYYDPYSRDALVANRDSIFAQMKDFGLDWVAGIGDSITTAYAQEYEFDWCAVSGSYQFGSAGWTFRPVRLRSQSPTSFDSLAALAFRSPRYDAEIDEAKKGYRFDQSSQVGRIDPIDGLWRECLPNLHGTGWALADFLPNETVTHSLGKTLIFDTMLIPVPAKVTFYLAIGDTATSGSRAVQINVKQIRNTCSELVTTRDIYPQDFSSPFDPDLPAFDTFSVDINLHGIDCGSEGHFLRLWWDDTRALYVDRVEVVCGGIHDILWSNEDELADSLVTYYNSLDPATTVKDMYIYDEPWGGNFTALQQSQRVLDAASTKQGGVPVRISTATPIGPRGEMRPEDTLRYSHMEEFFDPRVLLSPEIYPFGCCVSKSSDGPMDATNLQTAFATSRAILQHSKELNSRTELDFWPVLQTGLFVSYDSEEACFWSRMREISPAELLCAANLTMCFLPDGICYFYYTSSVCDQDSPPPPPPPGGTEYFKAMMPNECEDCDCTPTREYQYTGLVNFDLGDPCVHTTYRTDKWFTMRTFNKWADSLAGLFGDSNFTRVASGDVDSIFGVGGLDLCLDSVQSLTYDQLLMPSFAEAAFFDLSGSDYFMLINRRCRDSETQSLRAWLNQSAGMYYVINTYTYDTVLTGSLASGAIPFTTTLSPGEGKLFKIVPVATSTVSGSSLPQKWQGGIAVGGSVTIPTNRNLTVMAPADIRVTAGGSYHISVYGALTAVGDGPTQPIRIHSANGTPGRQDWAGLRHYGPGDVNLKHVLVEHGYRGLWILNTANVDEIDIDSSEFRQSYFAGIQNDRATTSLVQITDSRFSDFTNHGIYIYRGHTEIDGCVFRDTLLRGVTIDGGGSRPTAGQIKNCSFDSLRTSSAVGVYLSMIQSHDAPDGRILESNTFGDAWLGSSPNTQTAIYVYNCADPDLVLYANVIDGQSDPFRPGYGILNYSTRIQIEGLYPDTPDPMIDLAQYGVYCFSSSSSDTDYAFVRRTKIWSGQYGVFVYSNSRVDLNNTAGCDSVNAVSGFVDYGQFNVWNDSPDTIQATGNWWNYCGPNCVDIMYYGLLNATPNIRLVDPVEQCGTAKRVVILPVDSTSIDELTVTTVLGNYPNPFNSATIIQFDVPRAGDVQLIVFNVLGQRVRGLVDAHLEEGRHQASWDGSDDSGNRLASGVYFYRLMANELQVTKKMVIVK